MSVHFEIYQTVIQSTPMVDFSSGFIEGSFLLLNGQKTLEISSIRLKVQMKCFFLLLNFKEQQKSGRLLLTVS